jgi:hypothetical protein
VFARYGQSVNTRSDTGCVADKTLGSAGIIAPSFRPLIANARSSSQSRYVQMDPKNPLYDPKHWQKRAEATRAKAQELSDEGVRQRLLRVAEEYERLAQRAERLTAAKPSELWLFPDTTSDDPA